MNFTLKTSKYTADSLKQLQSTTSITPNILIRYAVSLSLRNPVTFVEKITEPKDGIPLNRSTVTGEYDYIYFALIAQHAKKTISDEEYFPGLFSAHLERGIRILNSEYKAAGNSEKFLTALMNL